MLHDMENKLKSLSQEIQEANAQSESFAVRLHATEQELSTMREECTRAKELLCRYQRDRQEMKRRMKSKVDLIMKQEDILSSKETNSSEAQQRLERSEKDLGTLRHEVVTLRKEMDKANKVADEDKKTLANNQQVCHFLLRLN